MKSFKFTAVRFRESGSWRLGPALPWATRTELRPGARLYSRNAYRKVQYQRELYDFEYPEHKSCFIDAHKTIEADTKEEAESICLAL